MKYCHNNKDNIKRMFQLTFSTTKVISIDKLATSVTQQLTKYKIHMTVQLTFSSNKATTIDKLATSVTKQFKIYKIHMRVQVTFSSIKIHLLCKSIVKTLHYF